MPVNNDLGRRIVLPGDERLWMPARLPGLEFRVFDFVDRQPPWVCGELRQSPGNHSEAIEFVTRGAVEAYLRHGRLDTEGVSAGAGGYVRLPPDHPAPVRLSGNAHIYVTVGQMLASDSEQRCIDSNREELWLPGPAAGTEVLALHGHGSYASLLLRWTAHAAFQPRLDPQGEEMLVLEGYLSDAWGDYGPDTWIRNPVEAWQTWSADAGTLVYYKSGHFAERPA